MGIRAFVDGGCPGSTSLTRHGINVLADGGTYLFPAGTANGAIFL